VSLGAVLRASVRVLLATGLLGPAGCVPALPPVGVAPAPLLGGAARARPLRVAVLTRTGGFRHRSLPEAREALVRLVQAEGWGLTATEDPAEFARALPHADVAVFLLTTGDVLGPAEQEALEAFVRRGGGWAGVHSASDTEYDWPFYAELVGAHFAGHPWLPRHALLRAEAPGHPAGARGLPSPWARTDEWYDFRRNPRGLPGLTVLLTVDEGSYWGGGMGADHPVAWAREVAGGRAFYTALGHTAAGWAEPAFLAHLRAGLAWAGRRGVD
jgi:type 1 glutamine amidotransferase